MLDRPIASPSVEERKANASAFVQFCPYGGPLRQAIHDHIVKGEMVFIQPDIVKITEDGAKRYA